MMQTIFDLCVPRDEVLQGELKEDIFAARLKDVMDGRAEDVYKDARLFFENTYPTAGLKTLLNDALSKLFGNATGKNAVVRLETAFGGGKTHNLIALYHAAKGNAPAQLINKILGGQITLPQVGDIEIAGVVGSDLDPTVGIHHSKDGVKTYTLWGELAYQLGGRAGYALVQESEKTKASPGTGLFETLVGNKPTLIMLDEIARHLRAALAIPTATGKSNLADQTIAFLMSLLEFAASKERFLVVLTLAGDADAFSAETGMVRQRLAEALSISARQEQVLTPTDETEIYSIVTHRLFKHIDRRGAKPVFEAYHQYYTQQVNKNASLPQRCLRAEFQKEISEAYPFHPELLTTLNRKTATIPNFNQTRGALRLLAWTVRALWQRKPAQTWLIHPYHLELSEPKIVEDLTSRLDRPKFRQVIEADIVSTMKGTASHAQDVDQTLTASGKPPYGRRLGTTIFLHSLTHGIASGVDPADLYLGVLQPGLTDDGDDPAVVGRALERLYDHAWFLEYDGHRYRFKTEPSLNKIVSDEMTLVGRSKAKQEIEGRIRQIWKRGYFSPVLFPVEAADVNDDADLPKLAIMHFEATAVSVSDSTPPDLVRKIYQYAGTLESFRRFQNNVVFLVADEDQVDNMVKVASRYLAIGRIVGDSERMAEFTKEQGKELKKMYEGAELDVRIAITRAYRFVYYPTSDASQAHAFLRRENLPAQEQGEMELDQTNVILRVLRALNKVLTGDDNMLSAAYVKAKAWDQNQVSMTTEDLRKAFARKIGLRILMDPGQLRKTIRNGVETGTWIYYDVQSEFGYDRDAPAFSIAISDEAVLYDPAEASRLDIHIKGKWKPSKKEEDGDPAVETCPVCGNPIDRCTCSVGGGTGGGTFIPNKFPGSGAVNQAFQQVIDGCGEHKITHLRRLSITVDGTGKQIVSDIKVLGLAIPQFGKATATLELRLTTTYGEGSTQESFTQQFKGSWERYKRLKSITEAFAGEASEVRASLRVQLAFEEGIAFQDVQFETIRDVLIALEIGKVLVEGIPFLKSEV